MIQEKVPLIFNKAKNSRNQLKINELLNFKNFDGYWAFYFN